MNVRFFAPVAVLGCVFLASCYPYDESRDRRRQGEQPVQKTVTSADQQKIKEQRDEMKKKEAQVKKETAQESPPEAGGDSGTTGTTTTTPKPPVEEKRNDWSFANKVPGKEGFVFSPYNNKIVDVRDIPSGTLVQDPTYTGEGKGYFRVP